MLPPDTILAVCLKKIGEKNASLYENDKKYCSSFHLKPKKSKTPVKVRQVERRSTTSPSSLWHPPLMGISPQLLFSFQSLPWGFPGLFVCFQSSLGRWGWKDQFSTNKNKAVLTTDRIFYLTNRNVPWASWFDKCPNLCLKLRDVKNPDVFKYFLGNFSDDNQ